MNKLKKSKSIKKRFKVTCKNKLLRHRASRNHLLQKKTSKRKQSLRQVIQVSQQDYRNLKLRI